MRAWFRVTGRHASYGDESKIFRYVARIHAFRGQPWIRIRYTFENDWQEDVKTFRYTACPLSTKVPYTLFMLSTEKFAYESARTGNAQHRRIPREGFEASVKNGGGGLWKDAWADDVLQSARVRCDRRVTAVQQKSHVLGEFT